MKVLHLVHAYSPAIGGSEYLMKQISEFLANDCGDDVTVFTTFAYNSGLFTNPGTQPMAANKANEIINNVHVKRFPVINRWARILYLIQYVFYRLRLPFNGFLRMLYYGPISPMMKKAIRDFNPDIIVSAPFPLNHMRYGFKNKVPVILIGCMHTSDRHGFHNPRIKKMIRSAEGYIALTTHEKNFLINKWKINPAKIEVIGIGIDTSYPNTKTNSSKMRDELNISPGEPVIAFVGQHGLHKGIKTLIQAMPKIWETFPQAHLIIAGGTTPFTDSFKQLASQINSSAKGNKNNRNNSFPQSHSNGRIHFIDNVDEKKKFEVLEACDIFASPSGFESFGITILEAWSKKKPVVACNIEATTNLITDGENGLLVEYNHRQQLTDSLIQLLENPLLRKELGHKGHQKLLKNYTKEIVGKKYRDFYIDILKSKQEKQSFLFHPA